MRSIARSIDSFTYADVDSGTQMSPSSPEASDAGDAITVCEGCEEYDWCEGWEGWEGERYCSSNDNVFLTGETGVGVGVGGREGEPIQAIEPKTEDERRGEPGSEWVAGEEYLCPSSCCG